VSTTLGRSPWLYRDGDLIAVDKPAGEPSIPSRTEEPCTRARVEAMLGQAVYVVHRLDRETSGVLLFALHADAHRQLNAWFAERRVEKSYLGWTVGIPVRAEGRIDLPLHSARRGKMRPARPGEADAIAAQTEYRVERRWVGSGVGYARLLLRPLTGRQHQLRVHLRARGHPLLGDRLYGRAHPPPPGLNRHALHAARIELPQAGRLVIEAPLPEDLVILEHWLASVTDHAAQ
jgi:23S rRNA-/tRNA-specific pseudouridylate synthase